MKDTVIYRQTRTVVVMALLAEYFLRRFKQDKSIEFDERTNLIHHIEKGTYGTLQIVERHHHLVNKIEIKNPACVGQDKRMVLYVHFDFTKVEPTLNYTYRDSEIKFRLPDSFELEEEIV